MTHPFAPLARALSRQSVRYALIGVSGANLYAPQGQAVFTTEDLDLFLPLDADNLMHAWEACDEERLELSTTNETLDRPRDRWLAGRIIERRALTRAAGEDGLAIDLSLTMAGFDFDTVWNERRTFIIEGVEVPTARLLHIIMSKQAAGRPKDQLFLATHQDALTQLLKEQDVD